MVVHEEKLQPGCAQKVNGLELDPAELGELTLDHLPDFDADS